MLLSIHAELDSSQSAYQFQDGPVEINFPSEGTVGELKARLSVLWDVEAEFLELSVGGIPLQASQALSVYWDPGTLKVHVEAFVSLEAISRIMQSSNPRLRLVSLKALPRVPASFSEGAQNSALKSLSDGNIDVRQAALRVLKLLTTERGNHRVVSAIQGSLRDSSGEVRSSALTVLSSLASKGDEQIITAVSMLLADESKAVRKDAVETLAALTLKEQGGDVLLSAISTHLGHANADVRAQTVRALVRLPTSTDASTLHTLTTMLQDSNSAVQVAALEGLAFLAERGDKGITDAIISYMESALLSANLLAAAVNALGRLASKADPVAINVVSGCLSHPGAGVRRAAIEALAELAAGLGHATISATLEPCLEDQDVSVRQAAVEALANVSEKGAPGIISSIKAKLEHPKADVRLAAVQALANVSLEGDTCSIELLCGCLEDQRLHVRRAVVDSLVQVAGKRNEQVIVGALALVKNRKAHARRAAFEILSKLAPRGDRRVLDAACRSLCDKNGGVALAAAETLACVAGVEPWQH